MTSIGTRSATMNNTVPAAVALAMMILVRVRLEKQKNQLLMVSIMLTV